jgi:hypothetical protein
MDKKIKGNARMNLLCRNLENASNSRPSGGIGQSLPHPQPKKTIRLELPHTSSTATIAQNLENMEIVLEGKATCCCHRRTPPKKDWLWRESDDGSREIEVNLCRSTCGFFSYVSF